MKGDKLLRSMNYIDDELIEAVKNSRQDAEDMSQARQSDVQLKGQARQARRKARSITASVRGRLLRMAVAAATLTILMTGSVLAVDYVRNNRRYQREMNNYATDIFDGTDHYMTVNETVENGKLAVTLKAVYGEDHGIYMDFDVMTLDGTEIYEMTENKIPDMGSDSFHTLALWVDGKNLLKDVDRDFGGSSNYLSMTRTDDGSDPAKANIQVAYVNTAMDFTSQNIQVTLKDYDVSYTTQEDAGFLYDNIAQMLSDVNVGAVPTVQMMAYRRGRPIDVLPAGELHIPISSMYPDAYVDNAGFVDWSSTSLKLGKERSHRQFMLTIVPGSTEASEALNDLRVINKLTGSQMGNGMVDVLEDGRILVMYDANADYYYNTEHKTTDFDTTMEHLAKQICKVVVTDHEPETAFTGEWSFQFTLDSVANVTKHVRRQTMIVDDRTSDTGEEYVGVDGMEISGTRLIIDLFGGYEYGEIFLRTEESPVITLKNGTQVRGKIQGRSFGVCEGEDGTLNDGEMIINLNTIVKVDDIASITWFEQVIYSAEGN